MWNDETNSELEILIDNIEWNLNLIKDGESVFDCTHDKKLSSADVALEISRDAIKLSELLKIYDRSVQYDPNADK